MANADLETASQFRTAIEVALQTGEREAAYALPWPTTSSGSLRSARCRGSTAIKAQS